MFDLKLKNKLVSGVDGHEASHDDQLRDSDDVQKLSQFTNMRDIW